MKERLIFNFLLFLPVCLGDKLAEGDSASLPAEHRAVPGIHLGGFGPPPGPPRPGPHFPPGPPLGGGPGGGPGDPWPLTRPDMPQIKAINVQCEKTHMKVYIEFDRPFYGMIFSKGHYSDPNCVHLEPGSGALQAQFDIFLSSCGMSSSANYGGGGGGYGGPSPAGSFVENTIIIQYDPLVQEVWDQARRLRCTWYDYYEKAVTFRPFSVDMLDAITANFLGDNLQCWMQIQVGKGPWASEVSGIVKIGQTMTMVLAIKDDENKFDMLVRNCVAHDGKRAPIQLVDQYGCVTRPKIMSNFQKIKNFGASASVVSYAYFQAFKFPDSMNVHFQCVIQVCRYQCPEAKCGGGGGYGPGPGLGPGPLGRPGPGGPGPGGPGPLHLGGPPLPLGGDDFFGPAYPDPRIPGGDEYSASEKKETIVSPPGKKENQNLIKEGGQEPRLRRPVPVPVPLAFPISPQRIQVPPRAQQGYSSVKREGIADGASVGGRPRSAQGEIPIISVPSGLHSDERKEEGEEGGNRRRRRRHVEHPRIYKRDATEMTDIETSKVIQVVAPGDVAFNLHGPGDGGNETVVVSSVSGGDLDGSSICLSVAGFAAGLIMLLLVLTVAALVAVFMYLRIRAFTNKGSAHTFIHSPNSSPEFVKVQQPN